MSEQNLFSDFEGIAPETWKEKIIQDLKGKDYDKTLVWSTPENLKVQPFYTGKDQHPIHLFRDSLQWQITAPVHIRQGANQTAIENLAGGATQIHFIGQHTAIDAAALCAGIDMDIAPVSFQDIRWTEQDIDFWQQKASSGSHLGIDPLAKLHTGETDIYDISLLEPWIKIRKESAARWGILSIDGSIYKNSGGHFIDEIAFITAALQEHLHHITSAGYQAADIGRILIRTAIGPNFFFEIAKIKVIRQLTQAVAEQYGGAEIEILAESSTLYHSQLDKHTNILRLTTEALSAVLGGAEAVMLHPFDHLAGNAFSHRISRNIQHLLVEESYLEKQLDPAAGSYYIEQLVSDLKRPAWNVFLSVEKHKGYIPAFLGKAIPEFFIFRHRQALQKDVATRSVVLLGANQFPNLSDNIRDLTERFCEPALPTTLKPFRLSEPFELLRIRMQRHQDKTGQIPAAFLWEYGHLAMRKARATYAFNLLACAGIAGKEGSQPDNWDIMVAEMQSLNPQIIVLCSDNDSWPEFVSKVLEVIPESCIVILAGKGEISGTDITIYEGCNILETLQNLLNHLNIE